MKKKNTRPTPKSKTSAEGKTMSSSQYIPKTVLCSTGSVKELLLNLAGQDASKLPIGIFETLKSIGAAEAPPIAIKTPCHVIRIAGYGAGMVFVEVYDRIINQLAGGVH